MLRKGLITLILAAGLLFSGPVYAQNAPEGVRAQEISESDGIPVLVKHLPDWQTVHSSAIFTNRVDDLRGALGDRPVFDLVDLTGGGEAVTAAYPAGKLLIIEYANPQTATEADATFAGRIAELGPDAAPQYRRIGNYSVFVFDAADPAAANALMDKVNYEKMVQWLGEDPTILSRMERAFVTTTKDIFVSTLIAILIGIGLSIVSGVIAGIVYFKFREQKRAVMAEFSDAGGMIRLNLDGLTPDIAPDRLLKE